jgi:hypothetical protein
VSRRNTEDADNDLDLKHDFTETTAAYDTDSDSESEEQVEEEDEEDLEEDPEEEGAGEEGGNSREEVLEEQEEKEEQKKEYSFPKDTRNPAAPEQALPSPDLPNTLTLGAFSKAMEAGVVAERFSDLNSVNAPAPISAFMVAKGAFFVHMRFRQAVWGGQKTRPVSG